MLLTITTTHRPATDLGYLLHKNPGRFQVFDLSFGKAHVFYGEATEDRCSASLMLDVDPVGIVRGKGSAEGLLSQYVNDRPYVASSFLSVAISQVFGSALQGRCKDRPDLATTPIPLSARLDVLAVRGGEAFLRAVFEPLGYKVESDPLHPLDDRVPGVGREPVFLGRRSPGTTTLAELLTHLYVPDPGLRQPEALLRRRRRDGEAPGQKGDGWLGRSTRRSEEITRRYLKFHGPASPGRRSPGSSSRRRNRRSSKAIEDRPPTRSRRPPSGLRASTSSGSGRSWRRSEASGGGPGARPRLRRGEAPPRADEGPAVRGGGGHGRLDPVARRRPETGSRSTGCPSGRPPGSKLIHGSLTYRDRRLEGFDAAAVVEVVEHLDPPRLAAFERVVFEFARPKTVVITTPNREYNVTWENVGTEKLRHPDHRFEWTRADFREWAGGLAGRFGYSVRFLPVGPEHLEYGSPTQMAVLTRP